MFGKKKKDCCCKYGHHVISWSVINEKYVVDQVERVYDPKTTILYNFTPKADVEGICMRCFAVVRDIKPYTELDGVIIAELCKRLRDAKNPQEDKPCPQK